MKVCARSGTRSFHSAIARCNSNWFAQIHFRHEYTRPSLMGTHSAAFKMIGNDASALKANKSFAVRANADLGTLKPAWRAASTCKSLFKARSARVPSGPARTQGLSICSLLHSQTALSSSGKRISGVPVACEPREFSSVPSSESEACASDSGAQISWHSTCRLCRKADDRPLRAKATTRKPLSTRLHATSGAAMASANPMRTVVCGMWWHNGKAPEAQRWVYTDQFQSLGRHRWLRSRFHLLQV